MPIDTIKKILQTPVIMEKYVFAKRQQAFTFNVDFDLMEIHWFDSKSSRHVGTSECGPK